MPSTIGIVASGYAFSPLDYSPVIWLDAADTTTITSSGSPAKVSQWNDKSGNGRHVTQATSANQPTTGSTTINGRNALSFDGGDYLNIGSLSSIPTTALSIFAVVKFDSSANFGTTAMFRRSGNSVPIFTLDGFSTSGAFGRRRNDLNAIYTSTSTTNRALAYLTVFYDGSRVYFRRNGTAISDGASASSTTLDIFTVGANPYSPSEGTYGGFITGDIAEIIVYGSLTTANRDTVEDYLKTKWGI